MEAAAVHDPGDHLPHIVLPAVVRGDYAVKLIRVAGRRFRGGYPEGRVPPPHEVLHDVPGDGQGILIIGGLVVGHPGYPGMHLGAAQSLRVHLLPGGRPHQRRPAEKDGALLAHHHDLVAHGRNVRSAGGA